MKIPYLWMVPSVLYHLPALELDAIPKTSKYSHFKCLTRVFLNVQTPTMHTFTATHLPIKCYLFS